MRERVVCRAVLSANVNRAQERSELTEVEGEFRAGVGACRGEDAGVRLSAGKLRGENRDGEAPSWKIEEKV